MTTTEPSTAPVTPRPAHVLPPMADHRTPLIRDCWYVAGLASEITRDLRERTLLGTTVVMYRTMNGLPVIMDNRCVHRSFPLSRGRLQGDSVVCGYHGMVYGPTGQCEAMPSLGRAPGHARLRSYPVAERGPLVWVWMGDASKADEALIPDTAWLNSPDWASVGGQFHMHTNYVAMHENLLDQTHFAVLHADSVGTPAYARSALDVTTEGDQILIARALRDSEPPPIYGVPMKLTGRKVDRFSDSRFASPAIHIAHARIVNLNPLEGEQAEFRVNIVHMFTPEHQNTIHYWWFNSRDFSLDDTPASDYLRESSSKAYQEDVDALRWIQETLDAHEEPVHELSFGPDKPGLLMRRTLLRLAKQEQPALRVIPVHPTE